MNVLRFKDHWLSYFIALIGIFLSLVLWDVFSPETKVLPWLVLIIGVTLSLLLAIAVGAMRLAREQAIVLNKMNVDLKHEIAQHLQTEESKQTLERALLQGQKLQAMGTLAGGIAHDFNNILYAINGYVEMAREDVDKKGLVYKNLGKVLEASQRGQELIARILSFSRRHHHDLQPLELNSTLEAVLALLQPTIPASVLLDYQPGPRCMVLGNQTQLHQVIVNMITNAVDAMDGEGQIKIKVSRIQGNDHTLDSFPQMPRQSYCKIEISDTGSGIDQQAIDRIFEPFFTTKEVGKGTGLGLSIAHSVIKEHQGDIAVVSHIGHGTTFDIILPEHHGEGAKDGNDIIS